MNAPDLETIKKHFKKLHKDWSDEEVERQALETMNKYLFIILLMLPLSTMAGGKPCSGKKGGISHCEGSQFVCNDGSSSKSTKDCSSYISGDTTKKAAPESIEPTAAPISSAQHASPHWYTHNEYERPMLNNEFNGFGNLPRSTRPMLLHPPQNALAPGVHQAKKQNEYEDSHFN